MKPSALRRALLLALALAACGPDPAGSGDAGAGRERDVGSGLEDAFAGASDVGAALDARLEPGPDADLLDAGGDSFDAGADPVDASSDPFDADRADPDPPDAASSGPDADLPDGTVPDDAGAPRPDADLSGPDSGASGPDASPPGLDAGQPSADAGESFPLRVMAANLTSGTLQSYDPGEGLRLMQGVSPDVVLIQEFRYGDNTEATMQAMLDATFGAGFSWCREYSTPPPAGTIPNGIISRWPILECGAWDDPKIFGSREFAYARIDLPGSRDLWAVSLHLLTKDAPTRDAEAKSLVTYLLNQVPKDDLLVIGGDFNTNSMTEACYTTLSSAVDVAAPHPADQKGNINTNLKRQLPFDHVFADPDLRALQVATEIGSSVYPAGLVLDSRVYTPLYEIDPVQHDDSAALNMQHMGVVKDFWVPY